MFGLVISQADIFKNHTDYNLSSSSLTTIFCHILREYIHKMTSLCAEKSTRNDRPWIGSSKL